MHFGFLSFFVPFPSFFFQTKKLNTKQQKCIRKAWNLRQSMLWNMYSHTNLKGCFKGYHKFHIPNCVYFVSGNLCLPLALMRVFNTPRNSLCLTHTHKAMFTFILKVSSPECILCLPCAFAIWRLCLGIYI